MERSEQAIKLIMDLFDVESRPEEETAIFQDVSHEELLSELQYWIDQSKMIFGDVVIENIQGFKDSGVDIGINLIRSNLRFGLQVKSFGDIQKPDFYAKVKSQAFESDSYGLEKYIIFFGGDLNIQKEKIHGIIAELSQRNTDLRIITVPPEKLLTMLMAYRNKIHPAKLIMLDISNATRIAIGLAENLSNETREAEIKITIRNLIDDGVDRPHKFKLNYSFNKNELEKTKIPDDLDHLNATDDVIGMKKSEFERLAVSDDKGETKPDEILIFNERLNRVLIYLQALSQDGKLRGQYSQVADIFTENNVQKYVAKDIKKPLKINIDIDLSTKVPTFHFNLQYDGFSVSDLYEMCMFVIHLRNAIFIRLFIEDIGTQTIPLKEPIELSLHPGVMDLVFKLKRLEELSGCKFILDVKSEEEIIQLPTLVTIATNMLLYHRVSPRELSTLTMTLPKEAVLKILRFYKQEKTDQNILITLPMNILKQQVIFPNLTLRLSDFRLMNDINSIDTIEKGTDPEFQITLEARNPQ
jgi:hypothetical protein